MSNFYETLLSNNIGRSILKNVGLPTPISLQRYRSDEPTFFRGDLLLGVSSDSELTEAILKNLQQSDARVFYPAASPSSSQIIEIANKLGIKVTGLDISKDMTLRFDAIVFDATGFKATQELNDLYHFFQPIIRNLRNNSRVIIAGRPHLSSNTAYQAATMRSLEGFSRSLAKEIGKKSATCQLLSVEKNAESNIDAVLRFLLSAKSAYVNAQVFNVQKAQMIEYPNWHKPLQGKVAVVTGASRGIGESIAKVLARDGAKVVGVDIASTERDLHRIMTTIDGEMLLADISSETAPQMISDQLGKLGGADIIVHNAGITRDKTLANMPKHWWSSTIDINLSSEERINDEVIAQGTINKGGRIICVSSINGIAGQMGQTNYATSKAGVIGYVEYMSDKLTKKQITINAVAPGFIETQMTNAIPFVTREVGRRLNSLSQGGKPVDVAETIALFANPAANSLSGNIIRVCDQSLIGA